MRVGLAFERYGPYHWARAIAANERCRITAIEGSPLDTTYAWDAVPISECLPFCTLFPDSDIAGLQIDGARQKVQSVLSGIRPDVIAIPGWSSRFALLLLEWCTRTGTPAVLMSDSTATDVPRMRHVEYVKRILVSLFSAAFVAGSPQRRYVEQLGIKTMVTDGYDVVDNSYFAEGARRARHHDKELRRELRLPENFFLVSSRFVPKKNLSGVIDAFARYRSAVPSPWDLVILGDGPLRQQLQLDVKTRALDQHVQFQGFVQYSDLPQYYGLAGALILASTSDQWGLVVNEAMASGLPIIVSRQCGCASDLVAEGANGFTFDATKPEELAVHMTCLTANPVLRAEMAGCSSNRILNWGLSRFADGLLEACQAAARQGARSPTIAQRLALLASLYR